MSRATRETAAGTGLTEDEIRQNVGGDVAMDIVRLARAPAPIGAGHYERTASREKFVIVPAGEAVEDEAERVSLTALVVTRAESLAAAQMVSDAGRMHPEAQAAFQEERQHLAEEQKRILLEATAPERLAEISLGAIAHMQLPEEALQIVKSAVEAGDAGGREREELYMLRRYVDGPTGEIEPAWSLHRWSPDAPRPKRGAFGPGSDTFSVAQLVTWAGDREEVRAMHGIDVASAHGWGSDAFKDRGLEKMKELHNG
jgi:hypothetical protein